MTSLTLPQPRQQHARRIRLLLAAAASISLAACTAAYGGQAVQSAPVPHWGGINPSAWPVLNPPPRDPAIEARVSQIMARMTLEQKVGQVIQADTDSVTPEEVRQYRLGSILSGGNSAPGDRAYADTAAWLEAADAFFDASVDGEGVDIAIPIIWGIDAVHGHANLAGATVFPHNIGLGAARNPDLIERIMEVTAAELIVSGHDWTFAPTLAVPRDDRWGRTYEGFSEDPAIVASYAGRIVEGLQGRPGDGGFLGEGRVISTAKHFVGDGGTRGGIDQGDTQVSEAEMRDIHAAGYFPAIEAGVQSVMASFNSWYGLKMHGSREMLTDVLKTRMGFDGFVVGDWNGHGQIPGCTNTDCPQALNAGVDMYMAPDSWKGIYYSTLAAVRSGEVPMERLDDAVRRILRTKVAAGLFEKPRPSQRALAGDTSLLGSAEHRAVARQAVRESMVLLKNAGLTLPLDPGKRVLVVGQGADSFAKQSGGWTLSWQGVGHDNAEFLYGQTILQGIKEVVEAAGGQIIFDPEGTSGAQADVVIAVYGEDPYAEFQGDLSHLLFQSPDFDTGLLAGYRQRGMNVVSVFLSGRPMWVNPQINASDAFIAAWLPGTEGGGVADMLFRSDPAHQFSGRLPFSWPATAMDFDNNPGAAGYAPLFPLGYGLAYGQVGNAAMLSEDSRLDPALLAEGGAVFRRGGNLAPWRTFLVSPAESAVFTGSTANLAGLNARRADHLAQEDGLSLNFTGTDAGLAFLPEGPPVDWSAEVSAGKELGFAIRTAAPITLQISLNCIPGEACEGTQAVELAAGDWREVRLPLACFAAAGVNLAAMTGGIQFQPSTPAQIDLADVRLVDSAGGGAPCSP